jgi:hypothetical protein
LRDLNKAGDFHGSLDLFFGAVVFDEACFDDIGDGATGFFAGVDGIDDISFFDRFAHRDDEIVGVDFRFAEVHDSFDEDGEAEDGAAPDDKEDNIPI